ncbi:MAG: isochorismate synthase [Acidimicrobiia bacterium]
MKKHEPDQAVTEPLRSRPDVAWIRDGMALFGWGESCRIDPGTGSDRFERAREALDRTPGSIGFATFTFDEDEPGSVVIIPETVLEVTGQGSRVLTGELDRIPQPVPHFAMPSGRVFADDEDSWRTAIDLALQAIARGEVEKVVLSRTVEMAFDGDVPIHHVAQELVHSQGRSHTFLIDGLVGSSPELLVSKHGSAVRSVSLAGSADRTDPSASASLNSPKMAVEHTLAADSVQEALMPFCTRLERLPRRVDTFADIHHLATGFEGQTVIGTYVTDLVAALHPTAAVAGTPTKAAVELIREIEAHGRGRYAGPVGWMDAHGDGEFAIALRCGEISGQRVTLYTGVGLVDGSDPEAELEETRIKLLPMLRALDLS